MNKTKLKATLATLITLLTAPLLANPTINLTFNPNNSQIILQRPAIQNNRYQPQQQTINTLNIKQNKLINTATLNTAQHIIQGFTADSHKLSLLSPKGIGIVHNKTGQLLRTLPIPFSNPNLASMGKTAILNKNGSLQALLNNNANPPIVYLVHTGSGKVIHRINLPPHLRGRTANQLGLAISRQGNVLAYVEGNTLQRYNFYTKQELPPIVLTRPLGNIHTAQFSAQDHYLVLNDNNSIHVVDLKTGDDKLIAKPHSRFIGFSPNQQQLIFTDRQGKTLNYYHIAQSKLKTQAINSHATQPLAQVAMSQDRQWIALAYLGQSPQHENIVIIQTQSGRVMHTLNSL